MPPAPATRHEANGQPLRDDPQPPRPGCRPPEPDECIVKAVIYPSIGVARVGNSADEYFIGPEMPEPPPLPTGSYRDATGALKRQAARFRIYGVNAKGEVIRELSGDDSDAEIVWSVQLANTKAAWYGFQLALDIPEAASAPPTTLRNAAIADRSKLCDHACGEVGERPRTPDRKSSTTAPSWIRKSISARSSPTPPGAWSCSAATANRQSYDGSRAITFANNEGWHDDVSDGPVTAKVKLNGSRTRGRCRPG